MSDEGLPEHIRAVSRSIAAHGLPGTRLPFPQQPLNDWEWRQLVASVQVHRITGLLAAAVHGGDLPVTEPQRAETNRLHVAMVTTCLLLERDLVTLLDAFDHWAIDHRVLKGPAFAQLDYPAPSLRVFGDVDVLVRGDQFDAAAEVLTSLGYRRRYREVRPGFDRQFGKGASWTGPDRREVDLHRTFVMGPFGLMIDLDRLWEPGDPFVVGPRSARTLRPSHRILHACYHAALGKREPQLVPLRDTAEMLLHPRTDDELWSETLREAGRWGGEAVVARSVSAAWETFDLPDDERSRWATRRAVTHREERALRTYSDPAMSYAARQFEALRVIHGTRARAQYAFALAFPDALYGAGRHRNRLARFADAIMQVVRLRRPGRRQ